MTVTAEDISNPKMRTMWLQLLLWPSSANGDCFISSAGRDGIGHQMEAKLTCIATARALNLSYVHIPLFDMEHVADVNSAVGELEEFFGLSSKYPHGETLPRSPRKPLPWVDHCNSRSWFDNYHTRCAEGAGSVFVADNCWDFFWCHTKLMRRIWLEEVWPVVKDAYDSTPKPNLLWEGGELRVVAHIRQTDGFHVKMDYYRRSFEALGRSDAQLFVHSDGELSPRDLAQLPSNVVVYSPNTNLRYVIHQMVQADVFIAACSSLSNVVALLRGPARTIAPNFRASAADLGWTVDPLARCVH